MRIISGRYRGKKLKEFALDSTRPTLDKVKEAIFDMIQFDVVDAQVLDLFSGTGALGIEAISRDAEFVTLIDNNEKAIKIIKENLKTIQGDFEVIHCDGLKFLENTNKKYDVVLLDPPFKTDLGLKAIDMLINKSLINLNGTIIFETCENKDVKFNFKDYKITQKKYGTVKVYKLVRIK